MNILLDNALIKMGLAQMNWESESSKLIDFIGNNIGTMGMIVLIVNCGRGMMHQDVQVFVGRLAFNIQCNPMKADFQ